jgi:hypothetical protein
MLTGNKDVDLKVMSNLDDENLFNLCISEPKSNYLTRLCNDETFWRNRLMKKFPEFKAQNKNWKKII